MGIGTSDGKYYDSEFEMLAEQQRTEPNVELAMMDNKNRYPQPDGPSGSGGGGGFGNPTLTPAKEPPPHLEDAVTEWARGNLKANEVQKIFKKEGWMLDLRRGRYDVETFDPSGKQHYIQP